MATILVPIIIIILKISFMKYFENWARVWEEKMFVCFAFGRGTVHEPVMK